MCANGVAIRVWLYKPYSLSLSCLSRLYCIQQHMPDRLYNVLGYPTSHRSSSGLLLAPVAFRLLLYIYICKEQQPFSLIYIGTHTQSQEPYTAAYEIIQSSPEALVNVVVIRCITPSQLVIYQHWLTVNRSNTHSSILLYYITWLIFNIDCFVSPLFNQLEFNNKNIVVAAVVHITYIRKRGALENDGLMVLK